MKAKRSFGQNFLVKSQYSQQVVESVRPKTGETIIEIGPGQGALTELLVASGARIVAVELDRGLIVTLKGSFAGAANFNLIEADALKVNFCDVIAPASNARVVANLPYNISTPILQRLIAQRETFSSIVLMFQREVVERITAKPCNKERGFLSVLVENAFTTEYLFDVPPQAFQPVPKVWSGVVRLTPKESVFEDLAALRKVVSASFAQKRKTIFNNLKSVIENAADVLTEAGIDPKRRAETLTLDEWKTLAGTILSSKTVPTNLD